jgi:hypothetical protein
MRNGYDKQTIYQAAALYGDYVISIDCDRDYRMIERYRQRLADFARDIGAPEWRKVCRALGISNRLVG